MSPRIHPFLALALALLLALAPGARAAFGAGMAHMLGLEQNVPTSEAGVATANQDPRCGEAQDSAMLCCGQTSDCQLDSGANAVCHAVCDGPAAAPCHFVPPTIAATSPPPQDEVLLPEGRVSPPDPHPPKSLSS